MSTKVWIMLEILSVCLILGIIQVLDLFLCLIATVTSVISSLNSQKYLCAFGVILRKTKLKFDEQ